MTTRLSNTELLRRLVAFDTTSRYSNLPLIDFIADYLDRPAVRIERNLSADGEKANLVVIVGEERDDREGLVLSGHTDVVPAGEGWASTPFALSEVADQLVARGACDMKGFLAIAINQAAALAGTRLRAPLALVLTYDEEVGTLGARRLAETRSRERPLPRRAVIGEPTSLRPVRMHKGHLRLRLELRGKSAHSGYPHLGINAIEHAGRAIVALAALGEALRRDPPAAGAHFPEVPFVALNIGQVNGGVAVNVVPERCVIDLGLRLLPGMRREELVDRVQRAVAEALGNIPFGLTVTGESPPMAIEDHADHYRFLLAESGTTAGAGVSLATDAGWLQTLGLECVIWGPGSIAVAHQPNEYLPAPEFARAATIVAALAARYCSAEVTA